MHFSALLLLIHKHRCKFDNSKRLTCAFFSAATYASQRKVRRLRVNVRLSTLLYKLALCVFRRKMSAPNMPLQVVPEISDDGAEDTDRSDGAADKSPGSTDGVSVTTPSPFEMQLQKAQIECDSMKTPTIVQQHQPRLQPIIRRVSCDAQPLTPLEVIAHRHMLPP